jgi:hypothetical protein
VRLQRTLDVALDALCRPLTDTLADLECSFGLSEHARGRGEHDRGSGEASDPHDTDRECESRAATYAETD